VEPEYTMPGEGDAMIREILADAFSRGFAGYIAIEPHVATVFHTAGEVDRDECYRSYVEYGRIFSKTVGGTPTLAEPP
jgi:hypothetical protein